MKIVFTICSNNYLAQAKVLGDSIKRYNPEYKFVIGLCDRKSEFIDYKKEIGHELVLVEELGIPEFDNLWKEYDIVELNTCVKPFFFNYFISKYENIEFLHYFDPDTFLFSSLQGVESEFCDNNILLTPHITSAIDLDDMHPRENLFLNYGIYNLGYLGLKNPKESLALIDWWKERTYKLGYNNPLIGLFVDQLWFNLVPLFYPKVKVSFHSGLNMAPWNLHDKFLSRQGGEYVLNDNNKLIFYHFSNYSFRTPDVLTTSYNRYSFQNRPDLKGIYDEYLPLLLQTDLLKFSQISCAYMVERVNYLNQVELERKKAQQTFSWWLKRLFRNILPPFFTKFLNKVLGYKFL